MTAFGIRSRGYQAGVVMLYITTGLFIIGIVSPMWLHYNREIIGIREERKYAGVIVGCRYNLRKVGAEPFDYTRCSFGFATAFENMRELQSMGGWVHAVETFEILSAMGLIFACIYAALFNCFVRHPGRRTRILEIATGISGFVAFVFCMVFVGQLREEVERNIFFTFNWAFYLSVISSIAAMVTALVIALFNEYIPPPADYNYSNINLAGSRGGPPSVVSYNAQNDALWGTRGMARAGTPSFYDDGPRVSSRAGSRVGGYADQELDPRVVKANYDGRNGARYESDF